MEAAAKRFGLVAAGATIVAFYALDQVTKGLVIRKIVFENGEVTVIPGFFSLVYWGNTGAAFSSFTDNNGMFIGLSLLTLAVLLGLAIRGAFHQTATRLAVSLLGAGVLGNVTDRIRHHYVVDFLLFDFHVPHANPWPAFNVADSCICIAACLLVASAWLEERKKH
jgi:signal peptidase II